MLDQSIRTAILQLSKNGQGVRAIARALRLSRDAVRTVLKQGSEQVPALERVQALDPHRDAIVELHARCEGSLTRVHEELAAKDICIGYSTLTAWCRRHGLCEEPKPPAGRYEFSPGQEMQHDTSPFEYLIGGVRKSIQIAALVLCFSRLVFLLCFPRFRRFECKHFLSQALRYVGKTCAICMVDNTNVVRSHGTGKDMVPAPEMAAFGERLGFKFAAHEVGDADRSARVEGHIGFVQKNFFRGREFRDFDDLNAQAVAWCDKVNAAYSSKLHASRRELYAAELAHLKPLPAWVPEVYQLHQRIVDLEGFIHLETNLYSAPWRLIGKSLEVRETWKTVELFDGPRRLALHPRLPEPCHKRVWLPEHRPPRGQGTWARKSTPEEDELRRVFPEGADYLALLKQRTGGRYSRDLRRLLRFVEEYPRPPLAKAIATALQYGLCDLERLERLVLQQVASDFFLVPTLDHDPENPDDR